MKVTVKILIFGTYEPPHDKTNKMICAPSEDSDQPGHPPSLIRVFTVRMKKHWVLSYPMSALRRLWSDWADAQAVLSLCWAHIPFCWFCHETAHISMSKQCCPHEETLGPELPYERTTKTLIRLGRCPGCSESLLGAHTILLVLSWDSSYKHEQTMQTQIRSGSTAFAIPSASFGHYSMVKLCTVFKY